jgi:hypothetical protein
MFAARNALFTRASVVNFIGVNTSSSATVTIPTHQIGDIIIIWGYRGNGNVAFTKPSAGGTVPAWVDIDNNAGANTNVSRCVYFVATATNTTSGSWTSVGLLYAVVLRGQNASPIGGHAEAGSTATGSATAPSVTMSRTDGTSMLLHFIGQRATFTWNASPAGYTQRATFSPGSTAILLSKDVTTSDGSVTNTNSNGTNVGYRGQTVEILAA